MAMEVVVALMVIGVSEEEAEVGMAIMVFSVTNFGVEDAVASDLYSAAADDTVDLGSLSTSSMAPASASLSLLEAASLTPAAGLDLIHQSTIIARFPCGQEENAYMHWEKSDLNCWQVEPVTQALVPK